MKREYLFPFGWMILIGVMLCSLFGCVSTLTWRIEPVNKVVKTEQAKKEPVKKKQAEKPKTHAEKLKVFGSNEFDRMSPPIK